MSLPDLPDVYFIRHGETDWNAEGRYQGQRDIPLNARGQAQADGNGPLLRELLEGNALAPGDFHWISSPLMRTRETIERVRAAFSAPLPPVEFEPALIEISFGQFEGLLHSELGPQGVQSQGQRDETFWFYAPPGGESYHDVAERLQPVVDAITKPSIVVAHGGVARVFRYLIEGADRKEVLNWPIPQDAVMHFAHGRMTMYRSGIDGLD